jgi:dTDP-glucose 4,6-dehydratase
MIDEGFDDTAPGDLAEAFQRSRSALAALDGARILLTGGTGFIGRWLIALIGYARREFDIELVVLSRDPEAFRRAYPRHAALDGLTLARGDVRVFEFPTGRFTHIIHAATDTSVEADRDPATLMAVIIDGTRRVLEFAQAAGVGRLLYVSSGAIYGPQPSDLSTIPEDYRGACDPLDRRSAYGQAKRLGEQMCVCHAADGGLQPVIARAFAFVGPGMPLRGHFAIGNFIADAAAGRDIVVTGDGAPLRGYLYAGDLAVWLLTLLVRGQAGAAYNVGSEDAVSIGDLAHRVGGAHDSPRCPLSVGRTVLGT